MGGPQSRFEEVDGKYIARPSTQLSGPRPGRKVARAARQPLDALTLQTHARKAAESLQKGEVRVRSVPWCRSGLTSGILQGLPDCFARLYSSSFARAGREARRQVSKSRLRAVHPELRPHG